ASMNPSTRWCFLWGYCTLVKKSEILGDFQHCAEICVMPSNFQADDHCSDDI
ncbi:18977_t:CDS:1, partial [Rhizophagus irregularis]